MASPSSRIYIVEGLRFSLDVLKAMSSILPGPFSQLIELAQKVIEISETVRGSREDCASLRSRILQLLVVIMAAAKNDSVNENGRTIIPQHLTENIDRFRENLEAILKTLSKLSDDLKSKRLLKKVKAFVLSNPHAETIKKCKEDLDWAVAAFEVSSRVGDAVHLCELTTKVNAVLNDRRLESLPRAKYASHSSERPDRPSTCFEGTRTGIIDLIFDWVYDPDPASEQIFFLNGIAGVGKTTIARTVAGKARGDGLLGGDFFFSRQGEAELRDASKVFPTLAYQLAHFDPEFGQRIVEALEKDPQAPFEGLKQQLDHLIINPLSNIKRDAKGTVVLVFDAFDECEPRGAKEILQLLLAAIPNLPFFLKIFLTGRPEHHILSILSKPTKGLATTALHDIEPLIVKTDIGRYLRAKLAELPGELGLHLPDTWASEEEIELLIEKSDGLFIYAVTALRFLSDHFVLNPRLQLKILMGVFRSNSPGPTNAQPFRDLDALYMQLLRCTLSSANLDYVLVILQAVVGTLVILRDPLPQTALEDLAGLQPGEATSPLRLLQSVILAARPPDNCPTIYHPSFPDFIQDPRRCTDERFRIDTPLHETRMALACLRLINSALHKDMMADVGDAVYNNDVEDLETKVASAYPPAVRYACRHWASHLVQADRNDSIATALEMFARRSLLVWLEAISWLGETRSALRCMDIGKEWASTSGSSSDTQELLNDCHRLFLAHFSTITNSAPQIIRSVIPFLPRHTLLASTYPEYTDHSLKVLRGVDATWSPCLMVINTGRPISSVDISLDQTRLVCGGGGGLNGGAGGTVQILDLLTGVNLAVITMDADSWSFAESASFSPGGTEVMAAISGGPICVWETATGRKISSYQEASVAFMSPDGSRLASARKGTVRLWSVGNEAAAIELEGLRCSLVHALAFSPDSRELASVGSDGLVQTWDAESGSHIMTMVGDSERARCLVFSPDGRLLASGSEDKAIRVWNAKSPALFRTLNGHSAPVNSLAFSPNGEHVVSGSDDHSVMVWTVANGDVVAVFREHTKAVTSVAFYADGTKFASGSLDKSVRLWDLTARLGSSAGEVHSHAQDSPSTMSVPGPQDHTSLSFSPDGTKLTHTFSLKSKNIFQISSGTNVLEWEGPPHTWVHATVFSPDGRQVASANSCNTVFVWDTNTGTSVATLKGHSAYINAVTFSPDGSCIASASDDHTIQVWDTASAALIAIVDPSSGLRMGFTAITFSPDGKSVASGSDEGSIHIWSLTALPSTLPSSSPRTAAGSISDSYPAGRDHPVYHGHNDICCVRTPETIVWEDLQRRSRVAQVAYFPDSGHITSLVVDSHVTFRGQTWDVVSGAGVTAFEDEGIWAASLLFDSEQASKPMHEHGEDSLAIVAIGPRGRLQLRRGKQTKTWILPPTITPDGFGRIPFAVKQLGAETIRCAIGPAMGPLLLLELQM